MEKELNEIQRLYKNDEELTVDQHQRRWALEYAIQEHEQNAYKDDVPNVEERAEIFYNFLKGKE